MDVGAGAPIGAERDGEVGHGFIYFGLVGNVGQWRVASIVAGTGAAEPQALPWLQRCGKTGGPKHRAVFGVRVEAFADEGGGDRQGQGRIATFLATTRLAR